MNEQPCLREPLQRTRAEDGDRLGRPGTVELLSALGFAFICGLLVQAPHLLMQRAHENLDFTVHYNYAREYAAALAAGDVWPRWAYLAQHGLGEPGLLYYSPLYYIGAAILSRLTGNVWIAMQLVEALSAAVLGIAVWSLARSYAPSRIALIAIPLAIFSPMLCLLQLGFNGYPWACATAPTAALFWAVLRPEARGRLVNVPAVIALACAVMMHTVSGLMAVLVLGAIPLTILASRRAAAFADREFWAPGFTLLGGLLLSAVYLLAAFGLQNLVNPDVWRVNYTPFNAFSLPTATAWTFGVRWFAFQWPISLVALVMTGLALYLLARMASDEADRRLVRLAGGMALVILFLSTELSYPLWLIDSPLRNVQFPHRFIGLLVPLGASLATIALARARHSLPKAALTVCAAGSVALALAVVAKAAIYDGKRLEISENQFLPYPGLDEYRTALAERTGNQAREFDFARECTAKHVVCQAGARRGRGMDWMIDASRPIALRLPIYCFPAWAVIVNGVSQTSSCDPQLALVSVNLRQGRSTVRVEWQMLPEEKTGLLLSLAALLGLVAMTVCQRIKRSFRAAGAAQKTLAGSGRRGAVEL